jgi:hypothetical protein
MFLNILLLLTHSLPGNENGDMRNGSRKKYETRNRSVRRTARG